MPRGQHYGTKAREQNIWNVTATCSAFWCEQAELHSQTEKSMTVCEQSLLRALSSLGKWMEQAECYQQGY